MTDSVFAEHDKAEGLQVPAGEHCWKWSGQDERYYFGDSEKPYAVDYWTCTRCGKKITLRGSHDPKPGRCPGRK